MLRHYSKRIRKEKYYILLSTWVKRAPNNLNLLMRIRYLIWKSRVGVLLLLVFKISAIVVMKSTKILIKIPKTVVSVLWVFASNVGTHKESFLKAKTKKKVIVAKFVIGSST